MKILYLRLQYVECLECLEEKGLPRKFEHVLFCPVKLAFFLNVYVFVSCFRTIAVIYVLKKEEAKMGKENSQSILSVT